MNFKRNPDEETFLFIDNSRKLFNNSTTLNASSTVYLPKQGQLILNQGIYNRE
jgi:hypothetical protein